MRISIGGDHHGVEAKARLMQLLRNMGHEVANEGTDDNSSVDYPDYASAVAKKVSTGDADRGILICGSGIGMSIAANKFQGVRAALCRDENDAKLSRQHNDANILCMPGKLDEELSNQLAELWITTEFEGERHERRVNKISEIEQRESPCG